MNCYIWENLIAIAMKDPGKIDVRKDALSFKFKGDKFFETLVRGTFDLTKGTLGYGTLKSLWESFESESSKERDLFMLIIKCLGEAFRSQIGAELDQAYIDEQKNLVFDNKQLDAEAFRVLKDKSYTLQIEHFKHPEQLPLLKDFSAAYDSWLQDSFGMSERRAAGLATEFKYYFGYQYYEELRAGGYEAFKAWLNDDSLEEQRKLINRKQYNAQLREYYYAPSLGQQEVALADIYIDPDFLVLDKLLPAEKRAQLKENKQQSGENHFLKTEYQGSIHQYFRQHFLPQRKATELNCPQEESRMMILLGQPGHGKSSFCYRMAYDLLSTDDFNGTVQFVRLREAGKNITQTPREELAKLLKRSGLEAEEDWENETFPTVLLLDGLDELCMAQSLSDQDIRELLRECEEMIKDHPNLFITITSRFNYLPSDRLRKTDALVLSLGTLTLPQQKKLIEKYSNRKANEINLDQDFLEEVNEEGGEYPHIKELIELPILLQMILISEIDLKGANSRAAIYRELFTQVLNRKWDKDGRLKKYADKNDFQPKDLRAYLSFLAFKIYQSPRAYLNRSEISGFEETEDFIRDFLSESDDAENMDGLLKDVLTSFYLQEKRKHEDDEEEETKKQHYAIEFLHKSLYEYLCCEYLWYKTKDVFLKSNGRPQYHNFKKIGENIQRLFAHTRLSEEMLEYLEEIIGLDTACHQALQKAMAHTLPSMLKHGCIYQYPLAGDQLLQRFTPSQQALHVFHCFWAIFGWLRMHEVDEALFFESEWSTFHDQFLASLSVEEVIEKHGTPPQYESKEAFTNSWKETDSLANASLPDQNYLRSSFFREHHQSLLPELPESVLAFLPTWLRQLSAERLAFYLPFNFGAFAAVDLAGLNAPKVLLRGADLRGADLHGADLRGADLRGADLSGADLRGADLRGADLRGADLHVAALREAALREAALRGADLRWAELSGAFLSGADLRRADLSGAFLRGAFLSGADLSGAFLRGADLRWAFLRGADLRRAVLRGAVLRGAVLSGCIISRRSQLDRVNKSSLEDFFTRYNIPDDTKRMTTRWGEVEGYLIREKASD